MVLNSNFEYIVKTNCLSSAHSQLRRTSTHSRSWSLLSQNWSCDCYIRSYNGAHNDAGMYSAEHWWFEEHLESDEWPSVFRYTASKNLQYSVNLKKQRGKVLTTAEEEYNNDWVSVRIVVENTISQIKNWNICRYASLCGTVIRGSWHSSQALGDCIGEQVFPPSKNCELTKSFLLVTHGVFSDGRFLPQEQNRICWSFSWNCINFSLCSVTKPKVCCHSLVFVSFLCWENSWRNCPALGGDFFG